MKTNSIYKEAMTATVAEFNTSDMFTLGLTDQKINKVIKNHKEINDYNASPYDKRIDSDGNKIAPPKRIELDDDTLNKLHHFINKISLGVDQSNVFDEPVN